MILDETYNLIKTKYGNRLKDLRISDIRIGVFLTAVLLSDGSSGAAGTNIDMHSHCYKKDRDFGNFSPARIKGQKVIDLFESDSSVKIKNTLKVAVLNAVSSKIIQDGNYKILNNTDPIDLTELTHDKTVTLVGGFQSYIKKISAAKSRLYVLELDENALNEDQKQYYVPADNYPIIIPDSDIVVITGLTLVNNTLDDILALTSEETQVILTGPSGSIIPDILFERNVKIIGATKINNSDLLFDVAGEAGTGFHLFKYCAEKFCIVNEKQN